MKNQRYKIILVFFLFFISSTYKPYSVYAQNNIYAQKESTLEYYFEDIEKLELLAQQYDSTCAKQNTLIFIRSKRYNSSLWNIAGSVDTTFEDYVQTKDPELFKLKELDNLYTPISTYLNPDQLDFIHMIGSINMFFYTNSTLGGWGGDMAQIIQESKTIGDMKEKFLSELSSFNNYDMLSDLDALNIYHLYRESKQTLSEVLKNYYTLLTHSNRVQKFVQNQFGIDRFTKKKLTQIIKDCIQQDSLTQLYFAIYDIDIIDEKKIYLDIICELFSDYLYKYYPKTDLKTFTINYKDKMYIGDTQTISQMLFPIDSFYYEPIITSKSSNIVIAGNEITAITPGTANLTIAIETANDEIKKDITIVINKRPITRTIKIYTNNKQINSLKLGKKETIKLSANYRVTYKSSNRKIATVSKNRITANKKGVCYITAKDKHNNKKVIKLTVKKKPTKISFKKKTIIIKKNKRKKLKIIFKKNQYSNFIKWSSENKKIAKINQKGVLTGIKKGKTVITAKTYNDKVAKINITVSGSK